MAERGSNDKSNKTLSAYLVYDYIIKETTSDTFQIGKLNAYLEAYGIKCDNRAIMRDIEAINQAFIMLENELSDAEEANELLQKQENQLVMRYDIHIEKFSELNIALLVVIYRPFAQISLSAIIKILGASFGKSNAFRRQHIQLFHPKNL